MNTKPLSFLLLCLTSSLIGAKQHDTPPTQVQISDLTPPQQEKIELTAELLYLTSSLSTTFSDEAALLNNNTNLWTFATNVQNEKEASIKPEYNFGFRVEALYKIPPTKNSLSLGYTYIMNKGEGRVKRNTTLASQTNIQNDQGKQHVHLHIVDLLASRLFPQNDHVYFMAGGGMAFNSFNYNFSFNNQDEITTVGSSPSQFIASIASQRKIHCWGLGPKLEFQFGFHFTEMSNPHDASVNLAVQFASLFGKIWAHGKTSSQGAGNFGGPFGPNFNIGKWSNSPKFQAIPNLNCDTAVRYKYQWKSNVSLETALGYRAYLYWELKDFNRTVIYKLYSTAFVSDTETTRSNTVFFGGPYLSFTVGF